MNAQKLLGGLSAYDIGETQSLAKQVGHHGEEFYRVAVVVLVIATKESTLAEPVEIVHSDLQPEIVGDAAKVGDRQSGDQLCYVKNKRGFAILLHQPAFYRRKKLKISDRLLVRFCGGRIEWLAHPGLQKSFDKRYPGFFQTLKRNLLNCFLGKSCLRKQDK